MTIATPKGDAVLVVVFAECLTGRGSQELVSNYKMLFSQLLRRTADCIFGDDRTKLDPSYKHVANRKRCK